MSEILPFKRKDFCGSLEVQERLVATSKVLRIQRLKEVRAKEKDVSDIAAEAYRQCIADRKAAKELKEKEIKRKRKEQELQKLSNKWQRAVEESGAAHERAKKNVDILLKKSEAESKISARRREEESRREKAALKLRHEQILETQRASMRLLELQQTKREIRMSDREDAHANGEAFAARQQLLECQQEAVAHIHSVPVVYTQARVQQGAVSIEQRFPVEVHAQVWRHGVRGAGGAIGVNGDKYRAEVRNGAHVEEVTILKKTWSRVMSEMLTKITTRKRAQTAKRTVEQHKGVLYLESELQRLEAADKAPARQTRICSALGVVPDLEAPRLQGAFEKMFLSKPVRLDNKHIVYSTGSHLVKANLEKHVQHQQQQDEEVKAVTPPSTAEGHPIWQTELQDYSPSPLPISTFVSVTNGARFAGEDADSMRSGDSSEAISDELHVLHTTVRGMYQDLDGCSTASDIPMISRPPPHWISVPQDFPLIPYPQTTDWDGTQKLRHSTQQQQNVEVRIPQVQARGQTLVPTKRHTPSSPSPSSPSSVATNPSTVATSTSTSSFSEVVSMKSSIDSESSRNWASPPLSIQVKGVLDSVPAGAVTPPRHQSSRGSAGARPINPFTPPEVSLDKRQHHSEQYQQGIHLLQRQLNGEDSPRSGTSSTNTEQARHDRLQQFDLKPDVPSFNILNESTLTTESHALPPPAPARGAREAAHRSPLWAEDSAVDRSKESVNVSALTEQMVPEDDLESHNSSDSSSTISELRQAKRALSSSDDSSGSASLRITVNKARSSSRSVSSATSTNNSDSVASTASSSLASGSLRSSTSSSTSSSMLSYLDSAKKTDARDAVSSALYAGDGVIITVLSSTSRAPARPVLSPSQSLESDSVSMLSTTSDEIRIATHSATTGNSMRDSFAQLTRQELQDVLDDISETGEYGQLEKKQEEREEYNTAHRSLPLPDATEHSRSTGDESRSRDLSSDIQDYASMFDSDDDGPAVLPARATAVPVPLAVPLPHTIDRIEEVEESSEADTVELDQASLQSTSTGELFDNWQQLYRGTLQLGSQARALRSEHITAYNASSATALSEDESFLSSEVESPPRQRSTRSLPGTVPASPLNVLVFPEDKLDFSKSTLYASDLRDSQSSESTASGGNSRSSDSLSPKRDRLHAPVAIVSRESNAVVHRTSVDIRASYESTNRATALMSELDKLSQDWREKQAYYAKPPTTSALKSSHEATPPRIHSSAPVPQPTEPPHYSSPSWLNSRKSASEVAGLQTGHTPASLSSLSAAASPPEETIVTSNTLGGAQRKDVYTGRLLVHTEHRLYPVTAAHLPDLAAQLELEDSMNSSVLSRRDGPLAEAAAGTAYSSEDEDEDVQSEDRSLEKLLNSHAGSETRGRIQSEIAAMRSRLLATVSAPTVSQHLRGSAPLPSLDRFGLSELRTHSSEPHQARTDSKSSSHSRSAGAQSSGEDTYSSSKYYSASEARNTSASTMHTTSSGFVEPELTQNTFRSAHHTSTTIQNTRSSFVSSTTRITNHTTDASSAATSNRRTGLGLYDDSSRAEAYSFTKRSSPPSPSPNPVSIASAESSLLLQQMSSPSAASVSRLSEYAMLSQHTLHTSRGSPGHGDNSSYQTSRGALIDDSYSHDHANHGNASSASDSSTFSEYMRHFPARK